MFNQLHNVQPVANSTAADPSKLADNSLLNAVAGSDAANTPGSDLSQALGIDAASNNATTIPLATSDTTGGASADQVIGANGANYSQGGQGGSNGTVILASAFSVLAVAGVAVGYFLYKQKNKRRTIIEA